MNRQFAFSTFFNPVWFFLLFISLRKNSNQWTETIYLYFSFFQHLEMSYLYEYISIEDIVTSQFAIETVTFRKLFVKFVKSRTWNGFKCNFLPVFVGIFVLFICLFDGFHISWSRSNSDNQKCKANYEFHFKFSDLNVRRQKTLLSWDILICNRFFHNILYCWTFAFHYANFCWNFDRISSGFLFQSSFFILFLFFQLTRLLNLTWNLCHIIFDQKMVLKVNYWNSIETAGFSYNTNRNFKN